ncbi:helix-turn-helix transcriptional regulator [Halopseudomonas sp. SMJS2]|uniref:helix-turn-helix domain-containing protein n=1 Tax=Halopseudomonas sp. SMJS2 TaxID=3041098 RepID=UPI0024531C69|nr:helix-turn-helix transcriptional regulator [Halopseudomonas sp. SMJS2]WGK61059.1 helix-turn-helix transcriptional regulator [Halopseudomonas sp. SMJS2]
MVEQNSLGKALKTVRKARGLSQEAFSGASSRTYLSSLERGVKNPTLPKLNELCQVMQVHPLTLLALAYADGEMGDVERILEQTREELEGLLSGEKR